MAEDGGRGEDVVPGDESPVADGAHVDAFRENVHLRSSETMKFGSKCTSVTH